MGVLKSLKESLFLLMSIGDRFMQDARGCLHNALHEEPGYCHLVAWRKYGSSSYNLLLVCALVVLVVLVRGMCSANTLVLAVVYLV